MPFPRGGGGPPDEDNRARDKAMRSIFGNQTSLVLIHDHLKSCCVCVVANVGFETTEEQLGALLSEVGPIVNLK